MKRLSGVGAGFVGPKSHAADADDVAVVRVDGLARYMLSPDSHHVDVRSRVRRDLKIRPADNILCTPHR